MSRFVECQQKIECSWIRLSVRSGEGEGELYDELDVEKVEDTQQGPGDTEVHCSDPCHFD